MRFCWTYSSYQLNFNRFQIVYIEKEEKECCKKKRNAWCLLFQSPSGLGAPTSAVIARKLGTPVTSPQVTADCNSSVEDNDRRLRTFSHPSSVATTLYCPIVLSCSLSSHLSCCLSISLMVQYFRKGKCCLVVPPALQVHWYMIWRECKPKSKCICKKFLYWWMKMFDFD